MIIWDADGVLIDGIAADGSFIWQKNIVKDLGIDHRLVEEVFLSANWGDVVRGKITIAEHIHTIFQAAGCTVSVAEYIAYWLSKDNNINKRVADYLLSYPSCIGSNQPLERAVKLEEWFAQYGIRQVFASSRIGAVKPEPAFYQHIEQELEIPPSELCLIDDTLANVEAAQARGWLGHHYTSPENLGEFLDKYLVEQKHSIPR